MADYIDSVLDDYKRPISGAVVNLYTRDGLTLIATAETESDGRFVVSATDDVYLLEVNFGGVTERSTVVVGSPPYFKGDPGSGGNTFASLAALKALDPVVYSSSILADGVNPPINYAYVTGNFTGLADDLEIVKLNSVPLTTGALKRQSAASVSFNAAGTIPNTVDSALISRGRSIDDFGARPDGTTPADSALASAIATGNVVSARGDYKLGGSVVRYNDATFRTVPADEPIDNTFGKRMVITNPRDNVTGYAMRRYDYTNTGKVNNGLNTIGETLLFRMNNIQQGFSWNWWQVAMSPLNPASGLPAAPGNSQNYSMLIGEANPTNRYGDTGWEGETRRFINGMGGVQMIPETQDFTGLLGGQRIGYNIGFGYAFAKSPYAATNTGRHAKIYTAHLTNPCAVAKGGYFAYATGYRDEVVTIAIVNAGSGYAVGDEMDFSAGLADAANEPTRVEVTAVNGSGGVTGARIKIAGWYQQTFANPIGTGAIVGTGTGATFGYTLSPNTDRPQAFAGIGGEWAYGIDATTPSSERSNPGNAIFSGAMIRGPNNQQLLVARNFANTADKRGLALNVADRWELDSKQIFPLQDWAPTITADSGSFGPGLNVTSKRWAQVNGFVSLSITIFVADKGTAVGSLRFTPPINAAAHEYALSGADITAGRSLTSVSSGGSGVVRCVLYDGSDPLVSGHTYVITGTYESANP